MKRSTAFALPSVLKVGMLFFISSVVSLVAQNYEFQKYYGSSTLRDEARKIRGCGNWNYIMTGIAHEGDAYNDSDLFLTRADVDGTTVWSYTFPVTVDGNINIPDWGNSVLTASDGSGFVAVGAAEINGNRQAYILKANQNGIALWGKLCPFEGSAEFNDVIEDEGNYIAVGWSETASGNRNILLAKFSSAGVLLDHKVIDYVPETIEEGQSITKTPNGYAIAGLIEEIGVPPSSVLLVETTTAFSVNSFRWFYDRNYHATWSNNIISTYDGGLMIVGGKQIAASGSTGEIHQGIIMKFDAQRNFWVKQIQGAGQDGLSSEAFEAKEVFRYNYMTGAKIGSSGYVIGGYSKGNFMRVPDWRLVNSSGMLLKIDSSGNFLLNRLYKPSNVNPDQTVHAFYSIEGIYRGLYSLNDAGIAAAGEADRAMSSGIIRDAWFVKTNGFGLDIKCYKDNGPEIEPYFMEDGGDTPPPPYKPAAAIISTSATAEYEPVQDICNDYHPPFGGIKRGGDFSEPVDGLIRILPNPVKSGESLLLELNLPADGNAVVTITDLTGSVVYDGTVEVSVTGNRPIALDIPRLLSGTYMVNIKHQQQNYSVKLMVSE